MSWRDGIIDNLGRSLFFAAILALRVGVLTIGHVGLRELDIIATWRAKHRTDAQRSANTNMQPPVIQCIILKSLPSNRYPRTRFITRPKAETRQNRTNGTEYWALFNMYYGGDG